LKKGLGGFKKRNVPFIRGVNASGTFGNHSGATIFPGEISSKRDINLPERIISFNEKYS
jgi:hypothetical protein